MGSALCKKSRSLTWTTEKLSLVPVIPHSLIRLDSPRNFQSDILLPTWRTAALTFPGFKQILPNYASIERSQWSGKIGKMIRLVPANQMVLGVPHLTISPPYEIYIFWNMARTPADLNFLKWTCILFQCYQVKDSNRQRSFINRNDSPQPNVIL